MYETIESFLHLILQYTILLLECIGALVIVVNTVRSLSQRLKHNPNQSRLLLTDGISSGLSFLLSSEILKTIVAPGWEEIGMTSAVLVMRAAMSMLVKWEEKQEIQKEKENECN